MACVTRAECNIRSVIIAVALRGSELDQSALEALLVAPHSTLTVEVVEPC